MTANSSGEGTADGGENPHGDGANGEPVEAEIRARQIRYGLMSVLARILDNAMEEFERLKFYDTPGRFPPIGPPTEAPIRQFFDDSLKAAEKRIEDSSELIKLLVEIPPGGGDTDADDP